LTYLYLSEDRDSTCHQIPPPFSTLHFIDLLNTNDLHQRGMGEEEVKVAHEMKERNRFRIGL
jgi:hypothetical protein